MIFLVAVVSALSLYGILTQRTWLGVLMNLQVLFGSLVVALIALPQEQTRTHGLGLTVFVLSQLQALLALGFAVRLHYLRIKPTMSELRSMKH